MKSDKSQLFKEIYESESDAIFRFCVIRVSNREQALDITQETFLRLWQSLLEDKEIKNIKAFLFTVAHRLIIDWYRKKKSVSLDTIMINNEGEEFEYEKMHLASNENILGGAEGRYLLTKIDELPGSAREPIYLRFVEGLSPQEIGEILGISTNAASVRLNRGLVELRKKTGYDNGSNPTPK